MFDTPIVIVGNVLTAPEWRRTANTQTLVANFRVASNSRRFDRDANRWVDGDSLRVRVTCWRRLAENVAASVTVGDPVVVVGRIYTRDWTDGDNNPRISYELEATSVGHDLARGKTKLYRTRGSAAAVDGDDMVRGEAAEPLREDEIPAGYGEGIPAGEAAPTFDEPEPEPEPRPEPEPDGTGETGDGPADGKSPVDPLDEIEMEVEAMSTDAVPRRTRRTRRQPVSV